MLCSDGKRRQAVFETSTHCAAGMSLVRLSFAGRALEATCGCTFEGNSLDHNMHTRSIDVLAAWGRGVVRGRV